MSHLIMLIMADKNILSDLMGNIEIRILFLLVTNVPPVVWVPPYIKLAIMWVASMAMFTTICVADGSCECRLFYGIF